MISGRDVLIEVGVGVFIGLNTGSRFYRFTAGVERHVGRAFGPFPEHRVDREGEGGGEGRGDGEEVLEDVVLPSAGIA